MTRALWVHICDLTDVSVNEHLHRKIKTKNNLSAAATTRWLRPTAWRVRAAAVSRQKTDQRKQQHPDISKNKTQTVMLLYLLPQSVTLHDSCPRSAVFQVKNTKQGINVPDGRWWPWPLTTKISSGSGGCLCHIWRRYVRDTYVQPLISATTAAATLTTGSTIKD